MKTFYILFITSFLFSSVALADVSQFVFITPEQTVDVDVISKAITVQSQSSTGLSEAVTETTDLLFQTTSMTGKFVAASGKPASKTMSKNTAKRSFYYIDSTAGTYTLTIKTSGRTSKKVFGLSQKIVVGNEGGAAEVPTVVPVVQVPSKSNSVLVKTEAVVKKKVENIKPLPVKNPVEVASSTIEKKEASGFASVIYTAPPKTSALESFLWLPKKTWSVIKSIFQ